jgi:outer membrane protein OmpA-like peptidoglycan-associated protein
MMKLRGLVLSGLLAALMAPAASAQGAGTVEFGIFARKNWFGESYSLADRTGGGLRLGIFPINQIELEIAGAYTPTRYAFREGRVDVANAAVELLGHIPMGEHAAMFLGPRFVYNKYFDRGNAIPGISAEGNESGPGGILGFRFGLGNRLSVRVDGTVDFMGVMGDPNFALNSAPDSTDQHWGFQAGLSWLFGGNAGIGRVGDADKDGVKDDIDQCPDSPRGSAVNASGCPPVNQDSINAAQAAAEAAAAAKAREDSIAAAERARADSIAAAERARADSIAAAERAAAQAARDSAAMAAGISQSQIAALRDSLAKLTANANANVTLPGVNFATGTATLTQSSRFILDEVAATLADNPNIRVEVAGHTDNTGPRALNERLSQQRADAVKAYLVSKGIGTDRMTTKGYAWDRPVASNSTAAGRARNRRTELVRLP